VRDDGPYRVSGPLRLIDAEGNEWTVADEVIALCRCGHSQTKPFCDGSHREAGFRARARAGDA